MLSKMMKVMVEEVVRECGLKYNFDASEALSSLSVLSLSKVSKSKSKSVSKSKSLFPLPCVLSLSENSCRGLRHNGGLYTQCQVRKGGEELCKVCSAQASKNESGKPDYGRIEDRLKVGLMEFKDPSGRSPVAYTKVMKKHKVTEEMVLAEAEKHGVTVDRIHFEVVEESEGKRGRPKGEPKEKSEKQSKGRPRKSKKVVEIEGETDDLFASLVASANAEVPVPMPVEVLALAPMPIEVPVEVPAPAPVEAPVAKAAKVVKAPKAAKAVKAPKAAKVPVEVPIEVPQVEAEVEVPQVEAPVEAQAEEKQSKAEEKKSQAALEKQSKAEEKKAQAALEKKAKTEAAALEKKAKTEAAALEKQAKSDEKKAKSDEKKAKSDEKKAKSDEKKASTPAAEEEADVVKKFEFEGVKYLKSKKTGIIYNLEQDVVGQWNESSNKIDFSEAKEEEEEEEYDE